MTYPPLFSKRPNHPILLSVTSVLRHWGTCQQLLTDYPDYFIGLCRDDGWVDPRCRGSVTAAFGAAARGGGAVAGSFGHLEGEMGTFGVRISSEIERNCASVVMSGYRMHPGRSADLWMPA